LLLGSKRPASLRLSKPAPLISAMEPGWGIYVAVTDEQSVFYLAEMVDIFSTIQTFS